MSEAQVRTKAFHERFVAEYLVDLNATQAYLRAKEGKVSEATAAVNGSKLLRTTKVAALVQAGKKRQLEKLEMTAANVMQLLWNAATLDPKDFTDDEGKLLPLSKMRPEVRRCIEGLEVARANLDKTDGKKSEEFLHKLKLFPKSKATELLAKHFRLVTEVVEHKEAIDWDKRISRIRAARKRVGDK